MTTRTLFIIILRVIGLFCLKDLVISLTGLIPLLSSFGQTDDPTLIITMSLSLLASVGVYVAMLYFFIYRAEWSVDKLRLTEDIPNVLPLAVHRSTVLSIALIIVGGLLLATEIPNLGRQLFLYAQERRIGEMDSDISGYLLFTIMQVAIGVLLISKQRQLVSYIELQRKPKPIQ